MIALITGSAGLIGSQACDFFHKLGYTILGIDNNMRSYFFGPEASTETSKLSLEKNLEKYYHYNTDIRDYFSIEKIFKEYGTDINIIIHTAGQPSHDWASREPITDFTINALGTINLLELTRIYCQKATFIFTSTNKVYGDRPNYSYYNNHPDYTYKEMLISELDYRYEAYTGSELASIDETMTIDNSKHSIFGASKVSADVMCQEYGKYFGMNVGIFRGGCLTGPNHAGAELHGFMSYLCKCIIHNKEYKIFGFKGKQVRDNIHSYDLINLFWEFHKNPKPGEVYNIGGGRDNSVSILESIMLINKLSNKNWSNYTILDENRIGDHIWYITDLTKCKRDFPNWKITISLEEIVKQIINFENNKHGNS